LCPFDHSNTRKFGIPCEMRVKRSGSAIFASVNESERYREVPAWNTGDVAVPLVVLRSRRAEDGMAIPTVAEDVERASLEVEDSSRAGVVRSLIAGDVGLEQEWDDIIVGIRPTTHSHHITVVFGQHEHITSKTEHRLLAMPTNGL
jgi:hypothetical protein